MERIQASLFWAIVASEASHVFCCALPTLFSVMSLMAGLGLVGVMPAGLQQFHEVMHAWEIPMMGFSAAVMLLGWVLYAVSRRVDCHSTGCVHEPCGPKKKSAHTVLKVATLLFVINLAIYVAFHSQTL